MEVHHEIDAGAFKARAQADVEREPRAGDLRRAFRIEDAELVADIPVGLRLKGKFLRLAPFAELGPTKTGR